MQPLLTRLRALPRARFDAATGRRRRGGVAVAAGIVLALFVGSGIAVAAVSSVEAHTPAINSDCASVWVDAWDYNDTVVNTVTVTIVAGNPDGSDRVETRSFGKEFHEKFIFADSAKQWSYTASIDAPDGKDGTEWDYSWSDTTTGCAVPDIGITASQCMHVGDPTTVNAVISPLDPAHAYTVQLTGTNGYDSGIAPIQTTTASWDNLEPGYDYTATLTDTTSKLSDVDTVHAIGCPEDPDFTITIAQCTPTTGTGTFGVTVNGLVNGRNYVLALVNAAGGAPTEVPFTSDGNPFTNPFTAAPSGTFYVTITDIADGSSKQSNPVTFLPCGAMPSPAIDPTECTSTTGVADGSMIANASALVPGRTYTITIVTGATTVYSETLAPAGSSDWTTTLYNLDPGTYTLTVTDTTDPASAGYTGSNTVTLAECPTQQTIDIAAEQCGIPGGTGNLVATVGNTQVGRNYVVTLTQAGLPVTGQPASQSFDPTAAAPGPGVFTYTGLAPGLTYRVMVEDVTGQQATSRMALAAAKSALPIAVSDITLVECPGNPEMFLTQPTCTVFTTAPISVGLAKLITGETYTVAVTTTKDGQPISGVADQQVVATGPTAKLTFDVPVGTSYTVTATNGTNTLTASGDIVLTLCDLETLAYTGASTMTPTFAGLGFLQFGLVLVGISLVRRRSGAREV